MADSLSALERQLIDEAVAEGRVQKVPTGTTGIPELGSWRDQNARRQKLNDSAVVRRFEKLVGDGMDAKQVGEVMGLSQTSVYRLATRRGLRFRNAG